VKTKIVRDVINSIYKKSFMTMIRQMNRNVTFVWKGFEKRRSSLGYLISVIMRFA